MLVAHRSAIPQRTAALLHVDDPKIAIIASHNSGFVGRNHEGACEWMCVIGLYQRRLAGAEPRSASTFRRDFAADLLQMQQRATVGTRCDCGGRESIDRATLWSRGAEKFHFGQGLERCLEPREYAA
jgi:hypothetical protein